MRLSFYIIASVTLVIAFLNISMIFYYMGYNRSSKFWQEHMNSAYYSYDRLSVLYEKVFKAWSDRTSGGIELDENNCFTYKGTKYEFVPEGDEESGSYFEDVEDEIEFDEFGVQLTDKKEKKLN